MHAPGEPETATTQNGGGLIHVLLHWILLAVYQNLHHLSRKVPCMHACSALYHEKKDIMLFRFNSDMKKQNCNQKSSFMECWGVR